MQYVGKVGDYVYNQWNSLNPATLSGAIDIIVIEHADGSLHCSPWHVRFGKFQIFKPSQKKIDLYVNDIKTDIPMKLGDGGEAFFVFETSSKDLSQSLVTSPVISAESSPEISPVASPGGSAESGEPASASNEPDLLDLNDDIDAHTALTNASPSKPSLRSEGSSPSKLAFEKVKKISQQLNIPSKIDDNGDIILDMDGYKPNSQKNIDSSDEAMHSTFLKELNSLAKGNGLLTSHGGHENNEELALFSSVLRKDDNGNVRIVYDENDLEPSLEELSEQGLTFPAETTVLKSPEPESASTDEDKVFFKTLRLTSEQLSNMKLQYGRNELKFRSSQGNSQIESQLYLWKAHTPIVISDIDGTITKSDALGHVFNMLGKDWTHPGVANLFQDITSNGYNIMYLTARSVGQADVTRQYLDSIVQDGVKLPKGPVILSPDRTMAALRREIILKKPEVFKMACLRDIKSLFFSKQDEFAEEDSEDDRTPFYAGFGNRITDAISYRSVKIPSHRIFTINPNGEVHMELLELAGYRSSYLDIGELVDQFFPPLNFISKVNHGWNENQLNQYMHNKDENWKDQAASPDSPRSPGSPRSLNSEDILLRQDDKFTDLNFWRDPLTNFSELSDIEEEDDAASQKSAPSPSKSPLLGPVSTHSLSLKEEDTPSKKERPISASFTSPLKNFMRGDIEPKAMKTPPQADQQERAKNGDTYKRRSALSNDDFDEDEDEDDEDEDEDDDDDYTDDDYDSEEDEDDEEDEDEEDEEEDEDLDFDLTKDEDEVFDDADDDDGVHRASEVDDEDIDLDDGLPEKSSAGISESNEVAQGEPAPRDVRIVTASDILKNMN